VIRGDKQGIKGKGQQNNHPRERRQGAQKGFDIREGTKQAKEDRRGKSLESSTLRIERVRSKLSHDRQ